jgi:hypothetical protein
MFNLSTYALLNLSAALETAMSNPSWRPTFRVKAVFSFAGFVLCSVAMFMISPGWTFVALGCEMPIFWAVKRRAMKARWGDMRTGLWVSVARAAMLKLEGIKNDFRNWRPDVLAFTVLSSKSTGIMELARAISAGRGMVTLASIVPKAAGESERMSELCDILRSTAAKKHLSAFVRVYASDDIFGEMRSLVHSYGFGPFVPDTVLVGVSRSSPRLDSISDFASYLSEMGRNAIFVREREDTVDNVDSESYSGAFRIDVWWRGRNQNGAFMLALASLVAQSAVGKKARIRLCQIVEKDVAVEEAERVIKNFLLSSRVEADTFVRSGIPGRSALSIINEVSSDAQYTFIGLRSPLANESEESYADYFKRLREETMNLRSAVFSLAANGVDFRKIYRE